MKQITLIVFDFFKICFALSYKCLGQKLRLVWAGHFFPCLQSSSGSLQLMTSYSLEFGLVYSVCPAISGIFFIRVFLKYLWHRLSFITVSQQQQNSSGRNIKRSLDFHLQKCSCVICVLLHSEPKSHDNQTKGQLIWTQRFLYHIGKIVPVVLEKIYR